MLIWKMIFLFDDEDLTWDPVSRAFGFDKPIHTFRGKSFTTWVSNSRATVGSSSESTRPGWHQLHWRLYMRWTVDARL